MIKLVLLRHGESTWNRDNFFSGWTDVDLTERGVEEGRVFAPWYEEDGSMSRKQIRSWIGIKWKKE